MFKGFNTSDAVGTISLLSGFLIIFAGVYLLNLSRADPDGRTLVGDAARDGLDDSAIPTDAMTAFGTRRSMQMNRRSISEAGSHSRRQSWNSINGTRRSFGDRDGLMEGFAIGEESDEEGIDPRKKRLGDLEAGHGSTPNIPLTRLSGSGRMRIERESIKPNK